MIRIILPAHLKTLLNIYTEITVDVKGAVTLGAALDALEERYPALRGTIRDHVTQKRRPLVRFYVCEKDISHDSPDSPLPETIASGKEPFLILGAIAGG